MTGNPEGGDPREGGGGGTPLHTGKLYKSICSTKGCVF